MSVQGQIKRLAKDYGVDQNLAYRIAHCENDTFQPDRKTSVWDGVHYTASGIYQFTNPTWRATRRQMGEPDDQLLLKHNSIENIRTALWKIKNGGISAWNASKHCWA